MVQVLQAVNSKPKDFKHVFKKTVEEYEDFEVTDFIKNPIAVARMRAKLTQTELAKRLGVTQAYISKIENDDYNVSLKLLKKVKQALKSN